MNQASFPVNTGETQGVEISANGVLEAWRDGDHLAVHGSTWRLHPGVTRDTFSAAFEANPVLAERDYGAIPPRSVERAVRDKEALISLAERRPSPLDAEGAIQEWFKGDPRFEYYMHVDLSKSRDNTGIAMCHWVPEEGHVSVDLIYTLVRMKNWELSFQRVEQFLLALKNRGFRLRVSFDGWQSYSTIERLMNAGVSAELFSVDRGTAAYDSLISSIFDGRTKIPFNTIFINELSELKLYGGNKYDHPANGCFIGETRVPLLDGTSPMIKDLVGKEFWVYSWDNVRGVVPGRGRGFTTKKVTALVDVVLDDGSVERCTPEHLWMLRDGSYRQAKDLRPLDRLMPIYINVDVHGYERVSNRNGRREFTHYMVLGGRPDLGFVGHHKNMDKTDNRPENLEVLAKSDHCSLHAAANHSGWGAYHAKTVAALQAFNESERGRRIHSETASRVHAARTPEEYKLHRRNRKDFRHDTTVESISKHITLPHAEAASKALKCSRNTVMRVLSENGYPSWQEFQSNFAGFNHRVKRVLPINVTEPVEVFDIEVEGTSNFALTSGVFVHNSKDTSDAVAGCVARCLQSITGMSLRESEINMVTFDSSVVNVVIGDDGIPVFVGTTPFAPLNAKFIVRLDAVSDLLILTLGRFDRQSKIVTIDGVWDWSNGLYLADAGSSVMSFIEEMLRSVNVSGFSLNESVPLDIVNYVQTSGKKFISALGAKKAHQGHLVTGSTVGRRAIQILIQQIRKGGIRIPSNPQLLRDLKYMTEDNQLERVFVNAVAGFLDFVLRQTAVGSEGQTLAPAISTRSGVASRMPSSPADRVSGVGGGEIDSLRSQSRIGGKTVRPATSGQSNMPLPVVTRRSG